jgi:hypothetical protein
VILAANRLEKFPLHLPQTCVLVLFMSETAAHTLAGPIAHLLARLVEAARLAMGMPLVNRAMATLAWGRMRRLEERFLRLKVRLEAGTLRPPRARPADAEQTGAPERTRVRQPWLPFLPRTFGWFARTIPGAGPAAQEFERLLAAPETPALISAAPQAGRILRPLAHMLGVKRPVFLRLPRRPRVRKRPPDLIREEPAQREGEVRSPHAVNPPPPQPPPQPSRSPEEEAALAYARRPGGLYWNGTGFRWS